MNWNVVRQVETFKGQRKSIHENNEDNMDKGKYYVDKRVTMKTITVTLTSGNMTGMSITVGR